ncbi:MAG TPA: hypothetical protein VFG20_10340 [Planctomycetaceae bacterium]|nr:hypothetical protein [Planctomycetaceae bacterium]
MMSCPLRFIGFVMFSLGVLSSITAAETPADFAGDARKYVIMSTADKTPLKLHEKSLLNWTNPVRQKERGETFVWLHAQRPYAIATFFTYSYDDKTFLKHEFHSLAPGPLEASFDGRPAWSPKTPGLTWTEFPESPTPANTHVSRSLQMRQLTRQFRAELTSPKNERTELRLSPRPLFEYSAPDSGVLDGAILSFVVATDPEILLLIEAFEETRNGKPATGFRYAFARFHYWDVAAYLGDNKVWSAALDKSHETNNLGDRENIGKIYNSFHPYRGGKTSATTE